MAVNTFQIQRYPDVPMTACLLFSPENGQMRWEVACDLTAISLEHISHSLSLPFTTIYYQKGESAYCVQLSSRSFCDMKKFLLYFRCYADTYLIRNSVSINFCSAASKLNELVAAFFLSQSIDDSCFAFSEEVPRKLVGEGCLSHLRNNINKNIFIFYKGINQSLKNSIVSLTFEIFQLVFSSIEPEELEAYVDGRRFVYNFAPSAQRVHSHFSLLFDS